MPIEFQIGEYGVIRSVKTVVSHFLGSHDARGNSALVMAGHGKADCR